MHTWLAWQSPQAAGEGLIKKVSFHSQLHAADTTQAVVPGLSLRREERGWGCGPHGGKSQA